MNFELNEILTIIDKVKNTGLDTFEYQDKETKIKIKGAKEGKTVQVMPVEVAEVQAEATYIEAPMVGTFYVASSPEEDPFVSVGDTVKKGQVIGIIEAMKLMNEIEADQEGIVEEILVSNETIVEYGQPLIRIRKTS